MLDSFIRYIQFELRYSDHTIQSYITDLKQLEKFLKENFEEDQIKNATFQMLRSWLVSLVEKELKPKTLNRKVACIKSFYKFLLKKKEIQSNPTLKLKAPKIKKELPVFIEEKNLIELLDHFEFGNDFEGHRDKLVFEILYGTGIRLSELINLKYQDINLHNKTIKVLGKGNKERIVPINQSLSEELAKAIELKNTSEPYNKSDYLIVNNKGGKSYPMLIYRIVKKHLKMFTTADKKSPHVLRHTFATHLLNKGADLNAIKELLGHTSLAATQVYTHNSLDKLKSVFNQAHPKA